MSPRASPGASPGARPDASPGTRREASPGTAPETGPGGIPPVEAEPHRLRSVRGSELLMRAAFGAAISVVAGLVGLAFNPLVAGMFLAFPAILPATITLIEKKEGAGKARADVQGATLGALALGVFAVVAGAGLHRLNAAAALFAALGAWCVTVLALYTAWQKIRTRV